MSSEWTCSKYRRAQLSSLPQRLAVCLGWMPGSHGATRGEGIRGRRMGVVRPQQRGVHTSPVRPAQPKASCEIHTG